MENQTPEVNMSVPVSSSKSPIVITALIVLVIGLVGGYLIGRGDWGMKEVMESATPTPSTTTDTSTWQTYRNDEYGFEFKYPDVLQVNESAVGVQVYHRDYPVRSDYESFDTIKLNFYKKPSSQDIEAWTHAERGALALSPPKTVAVGGRKAVRFTEGGITGFDAVYVGNGIDVINLYVAEGATIQVYFDRILSTFKFTR